MENDRRFGERRAFERRIGTRDCGIVVLRSGILKVPGVIVDISRGGLACQYLEEPHHRLPEKLSVDIFSLDKTFKLYNIPCITVSDHLVHEDAVERERPLHRRNLEFGGLTLEQEGQLDYFLRQYTRQKELEEGGPITLDRY